jgi:hypothetical protein
MQCGAPGMTIFCVPPGARLWPNLAPAVGHRVGQTGHVQFKVEVDRGIFAHVHKVTGAFKVEVDRGIFAHVHKVTGASGSVSSTGRFPRPFMMSPGAYFLIAMR